ncbi:MAG: hypothetical protein AB7U81_15705 [Thiohalomonadaceae bacterium]
MYRRIRITRISPLELAMRDVRENMADFAADFGLNPGAANTFHILSIEPPMVESRRAAARVVMHPRARQRA